MGTPWFEMGGKVSISCQKTNYSATIDFIPKVSRRKTMSAAGVEQLDKSFEMHWKLVSI